MKGKTAKAPEKIVDKIDAILEAHFASLPPAERERRERAFINGAKKIDARAKRREQSGTSRPSAEVRRHA